MTRHGGWVARLAVLALAVGLLTAGAGAASAQPAVGAASADAVQVTIDVRADGTAVWTIQYRFFLETRNETAAFEQLRRGIAADRADYVGGIGRQAATTVAIAENQTGREMAVGNVSAGTWRHSMPRDVGVVSNRFVWHGFAKANDTHLVVGDAIRGFSAGPNAELTVLWPSGYEPVALDPVPSERGEAEATWRQAGFGANEPTFAFRRADAAVPLTVVGAAGLLLVALGVGTAAYVRRSARTRLPATSVPSAWPRTGRADDGEGRTDDREAASAGPAGADETADDQTATADLPDRPLSNEEQLLWVLEEHDGRLKQQRIAELCDWSDSKTSRVVRRLDEDGDVDLFRLGRENVVSLPEVDERGG